VILKNLKRKIAENLRQPRGYFGWMIGIFMNHFNKGIIRLTIDSIPNAPSDVIVEVGIGSGKALSILAKRFPNAKLFGIDISDRMIKSARKRNKNVVQSKRLTLELNSIEKMSLASESVDTLYTINTIYFWNDPEKVIIEVYRVLKVGGFFIISFNPGEEMNRKGYPMDLFTFYSKDDVLNVLERNNFRCSSEEIFKDRYENYICLVMEKKGL
jgi:ubiquinone/menaquinone biosynthesis C-methylase UbiE